MAKPIAAFIKQKGWRQSTISLLVIIAVLIEYLLLYLGDLYEVTFCVSSGPPRGKPQDEIKCTRDLLGEMLVRENVAGARRGQESHQTAGHVWLLWRTEEREKGEGEKGMVTAVKLWESFAKADWESWGQSHQSEELPSCRNGPALVSLPCSVMFWQQPLGSVTSAQIWGWISEHSSWSLLSTLFPTAGNLRSTFSWPPTNIIPIYQWEFRGVQRG